jgi:hypothetical protein
MTFFSDITSGLYNAEQGFLHDVRVVGTAITHPLATVEAAVDSTFDFATHVATGAVQTAMPFANFAGNAISGANDLAASDITTISTDAGGLIKSTGGALGDVFGSLTIPLSIGALGLVAYLAMRSS